MFEKPLIYWHVNELSKNIFTHFKLISDKSNL